MLCQLTEGFRVCLQKTLSTVRFPRFWCVPCLVLLGVPVSPWAFWISRGTLPRAAAPPQFSLALFGRGSPSAVLFRGVLLGRTLWIGWARSWDRCASSSLRCVHVAAFHLFFIRFYTNEGAFLSLMKWSLLRCVLKLPSPFLGCQMARTSHNGINAFAETESLPKHITIWITSDRELCC